MAEPIGGGISIIKNYSVLYLHIPFCKQRCIYCDFYSTVFGPQVRQEYVDALCRELVMRKEEASHGTASEVQTVYFGGGTPSLLSEAELDKILQTIRQHYRIAHNAEITLEANPDDITPVYAQCIQDLGINRVSLGVQSLNDERLRQLHRRHGSRQACQATMILREHGITNLSIDLIYGLPGQDLPEWEESLAQALELPIQHLSAYQLTYEDGTELVRLRNAGKLPESPDEELIRDMYTLLCERTSEEGLLQYEISNYALPGSHSRHNSAYWNRKPYVGLGPGAHSFDGARQRRVNLPDIREYVKQLSAGQPPPHSIERLTPIEQMEECIMLSLRRTEGLHLPALAPFGEKVVQHVCARARKYLEHGELAATTDGFRFTTSGFLISDHIICDLLPE